MSRLKTYIDESYLLHPPSDLWYYRVKRGYVGKSHSVARYPYKRVDAKGAMLGYYGASYVYDEPIDSVHYDSNLINLMTNNVISKLEGKCGASGSLGSSVFAEGKESVLMAVQRLEWAAGLVKSMRRKDIKGLKRSWSKKSRPTTAMKNAGGKWLEFSFGWAPLVQTVFDGIAATGADFPKQKIHARNKDVIAYDDIEHSEITGWKYVKRLHGYSWQSIKAGFDVKVENPNTWLLGRLDLLNPGRWIWEAIPYSFFVDYFVNIGDMIHNLDSFAGLSFSNGWSTYWREWDEERTYYRYYPSYNSLYEGKGKGASVHRFGPISLQRKLVLNMQPLTSSWKRGLNASSFLAQRLK